MEEQGEERSLNNIRKFINALMLVLFLPVLFCVMFIGNNMDYWDDVKANILVPNALLTIIALTAFAICLYLIYTGRRIQLTGHVSRLMDLLLLVLFAGFYFFCMWLSNETVFDMSVDQGIVREAAKDVAHEIPFGYQFVFSMNYNNLPITYVLGRLYRLAESLTWFEHDPEYLWVITGCLSVTGAGFCCCEIVKKLTKNAAAVLISFALYLVTAGLSPWKAIPYTDSYGIFFPVLCILLYFCSRDCRHAICRALLLFFSVAAGMAGGFMKPSAYIAVLAVLGAEGVSFVDTVLVMLKNKRVKETTPENQKKKGIWRRFISAGASLALSLLFVFIMYCVNSFGMDYIVEDIELEYNEEIEATPQYFFYMGTKELTTGGFSTEDYGVFGEFQYSKADRNAACLERAWERIEERGVVGTVYFCLKKLVKSFNDGTFAWTYVLYYEPFPEELTHDNIFAGYMRSLFVPGGANQAKYDTMAELAWIFTLMGVPGIVLAKGKKKYCVVFPILIIGILSYLMLFESGARYVYVFLPVFIAMCICGIDWIQEKIIKYTKKRI
ncbi:MAG: hypothetical protein LUG83_09100 [Lachnospiraceae bacterium]|nr:hypothetical protein [Lachnospiraceae bacterium]